MSQRRRSVRAQVHHDRLLQALWPFGCSARMLNQQFIEQQGALDDLARWIVQHPARVTCITGPSGAGKSTLLARIEQHLGKHGARADRIAMPAVAVGALGTQPLAGWLMTLGSVGLAEVRVLATPATRLSLGQQRRLQVALAIDQIARHATSRPITLLIDEVASGLDRMTLGGVLRTLARLTTTSHRPCVQLIVCGCDEQLPSLLLCDRSITIDPARRQITVTTHAAAKAGHEEPS